MSNADEHEVDRTCWPPGPWDAEPEDRVEWRARGFPCLMVRSRVGAWCGYVGLPPGHPYYGLDLDDEQLGVSVHGGVSYAAARSGHVCHASHPGEPDAVWWIGFDCVHHDDLAPGLSLGPVVGLPDLGLWCTYRTRDVVRGWVEDLARQLETSTDLNGAIKAGEI